MKTKKIFSLFILIVIFWVTSLGFLLKPKPAEAAWPADSELSEFVYKFAKGTIWTVFKMIFFQLANWARVYILTGKSDVPIIPPDLGEYAEDASIEIVRRAIDNATGFDICNPEIGLALKLSLREAYIPSYTRTAIPKCNAEETWDKVIHGEPLELEDFVKISEPQNNFFGAYLLATSELDTKKEGEVAGIKWEFLANQGFLTPKKETEEASPATGDKAGAKVAKQEQQATSQSTESVIEEATAPTKTPTSELTQLAQSETWDDGLGHIPGALLEVFSNILAEKAVMMLTQEIYKIQK